jgi:hypothetical protein
VSALFKWPFSRGHEVGGPRGAWAMTNHMNPLGFPRRRLPAMNTPNISFLHHDDTIIYRDFDEKKEDKKIKMSKSSNMITWSGEKFELTNQNPNF